MEYDSTLYEADPRPFLKEEVDFYKKIIDRFSSKTILELGVGTGRIFSKLLPMVDHAVGIDISEQMLNVCRKTCEPNTNYELHKQTFVEFRLNRFFDLIYVPFNTFQHLLLEEEQLACLKSVKYHMNSNSRFILDLMNLDNLEFGLGNWEQDYSNVLPNGKIIERDQKTINVDERTSIVEKVFLYKEIVNNTIEKTQEFKALMKINPNEKVRELLSKVGFSIEDVWSDYFFDHNCYTKKIIYCLKRDGI